MAETGNRGVALVSVLWGVVLLSLLATAFASSTRTGTNLARNLVANAEAEALADAGVSRAVLGLQRPFDEGGIRVDGTVYAWRFADGEIRFQAQDEGGKIDLNFASATLLRDLFVAVGVEPQESEALADAIIDFRDSDDRRRPHGAEDWDYRSADLPVGPKNAPFELVEEVQGVMGMTGPLYRQVAPLLTVYSQQAEPNIDVAPPEIRAILATWGGRGDDDDEGDDDGDAAGLGPDVERDRAFGDSLDPLEALQEGGTGARSGVDVYTVHVEGRSRTGAFFVREAVVAVPGTGDRPYDVLDWQRGRRFLFADGRVTDGTDG